VFSQISKVAAKAYHDRNDKKKEREKTEINIGRALTVKRETGQQRNYNNEKTDKISHLPAK
jgi:hypothetical protein